ncbi:AAA family ATPase [Jatrophihabitans telluris]|uniref:AAA family ATPase n=1 Tax=Jatrophihabitans telluris TaxID=2038343 RepID=A0ABY4QYU7_9ACTN|nr:AAA family ATPase [Jatrophihabitans telluris]UQX88372.1 AAA family ATPase [Jatrophihabitans telluris]
MSASDARADPVLRSEQAHLLAANDCLAEMREGAARIADYGVDALASESLGRMRAERLKHLGADLEAPPFFGRTDRDPEAEHPAGEVFHIGRRHIRDSVGDPIVIDWRAPIARPFYRATADDRQGVRLRRRFGFAADATGYAVLSSYEDEHLDAGENLGLRSDLLRAEIERPRVGPMRDIVATIQPDQDELVRADLDTSLCIQGAPGTGKTAVGLHRAAYLLYSYPERLRRSGVLVVGPNAAFLRYIAQVLPALGENGITQTTVEDLVSGDGRLIPGREDAVAVAVLKGDARLAEVCRRAVISHIRKPESDVVPIVGTKRYRIPVERVRRYVDDARRSLVAGELRWDLGRERLRMLLAQDVRRQREDAGGAPSDAETGKVARSVPVKEFVDAVWPALDPREVLVRLYTSPQFLHRCGATVLGPDELDQLAWADPPRSVRAARFSAADLVLLDELRGLMQPNDQYVHVVVDEAQDLSAMQCRVVARRVPIGSVTVLGDLAQATTPWAVGSWPATMAALGSPAATVRPLTVGYRVPGEVLIVANRLLPFIAADVPPATSVRAGREALSYTADLLAAVGRCLEAEGSVAVIVPDAAATSVRAELAGAGIATEELAGAGIATEDLADALPARVTVVAASSAKGLEYDSVVLVEPAAIVAQEPSRLDGLRRLYVAWTRAVSRLAVVHTAPLPDELAVTP